MIGDRLGNERMRDTYCRCGRHIRMPALRYGQALATNGTDANHYYTTAASSAGATTHFEHTDWHGPPQTSLDAEA
jgi:hypothetical protein